VEVTIVAVNSEHRNFLFLSRILKKKAVNTAGRQLGIVVDVAAEFVEPYPVVTGLILKADRRKKLFLSCKDLSSIDENCCIADISENNLQEYQQRSGELLLNDALMDKQVVDTNGARIRRVNDLQLLQAHHALYLVHVDVGFRGLMRRVGLTKIMDKILQMLFDYTLPDQLISWKFVQPLASPDLLRLNIAQNRLSQIHPADLADILEDLDIRQRAAVFQALDKETAAETLEETDPKIQVSLITDLNSAQASDIIEEMSLSEATDLLADLPKAKAEGILKEMEKDIAEDVKELLTHPEKEAGGMMTTSFLSFRPRVTVSQAMENIRKEGEDVDMFYYVYITDEEEHLLGVVALRDLLLASPDTILTDIMDTRVISVKLDDKDETIADHFAKYGVTAIPVVDDEDKLQGIIMFKNLLEVVAPHLGQ
jgi:CBS domain-containing protein/sporulation protein YlmC with PRC-barrel domain